MSLGPLELAMLAAIALLFFGPAKLPQLGKSLGDAIRGFKSAMNDVQNPEPTNQKSASTSQHSPDGEAREDHSGQDDVIKSKDKTPHS
jgi:sec-independent protein translocase protein TatA